CAGADLIYFPVFSYCYAAHRHLPPFPTRRSSDLVRPRQRESGPPRRDRRACRRRWRPATGRETPPAHGLSLPDGGTVRREAAGPDRKSTRLNSSHVKISYAVFCLKKKRQTSSTSL